MTKNGLILYYIFQFGLPKLPKSGKLEMIKIGLVSVKTAKIFKLTFYGFVRKLTTNVGRDLAEF